MDTSPDPNREMILLEQIEHDPDITQAGLAAQLGVAVGTVNWHLKRLVSKGYVKVKRAQRRKLRYIITPEGLAFRARLTVNYVDQSMRLYRRVRQRVRDLLAQVKESGSNQVGILGEGDIADICRLTCLEQGVEIVDSGNVPFLEVRGLKVHLYLNGEPVTGDPIDGYQAATNEH
jgi:DNA-binding MarR family transcriptional regulator